MYSDNLSLCVLRLHCTFQLTGSTDKPLFRQATVTVPNVKIPAMISLQV